MRRLMFAASIAIANVTGEISESEIRIFEQFFGTGSFHDNLNIEKIVDELPARIEQAKQKTSIAQRMQVLRDLCIVARAEREVGSKQRQLLEKLARELGLSKSVIESSLCSSLDPD
jgi:tellurite resistance protein